MVAADGPLIFLNTSDANAPTGRNARVQARTASARRSNPVGATAGGHFETFAVNSRKSGRPTSRVKARDVENKKHASSSDANGSSATPSSSSAITTLSRTGRRHDRLPQLSAWPFTTQVRQTYGPLVALVNLEDALEIAAFHIRRTTAQIVSSQPEHILTALRCRQWSFCPPDLALVGRTPYLDSAIECVIAKVRLIVSGRATSPRSQMLSSYSRALRLLRAAVMVSNPLSEIRDVFAASQLLAIYEMLDFPRSDSWIQHICGAATIARLHTLEKMGGAGILGHAAPMYVESLMGNDHSFFSSQHWQTLLSFIRLKQYPSADGVEQALDCFAALREIFADAQASSDVPENTDVPMSDSDTQRTAHITLLSRAHELRWQLKRLVLLCQQRFFEFGGEKWCARSCDVLGLFLISIMVLDRLIRELRRVAFHHLPGDLRMPNMLLPITADDLEQDTKELCTQMIQMELSVAEAHPGQALLRALLHQGQRLPHEALRDGRVEEMQ